MQSHIGVFSRVVTHLVTSVLGASGVRVADGLRTGRGYSNFTDRRLAMT